MDSWPAVDVPALPGAGPEPIIWDTATGTLAVAAPGSTARLYACGITPYDATHIGHAATYLAWDLLIRTWLDAGKDVLYVQNVTDVDDPLLERANRDDENWRALADREIALFRSDMTALRVLPPSHFIGAVEAMPLIRDFSARLGERDALYDLDGDVYFSRAADAAFGSVSGLNSDAMLRLCAENGGDPARPGKKDPVDPLVWLAHRPGEPSWPSQFGEGRPGWHVECAAIATHYLGVTFDVQAGGRDLIFPHHEMSAAHARVALDGAGEPPFARRYAHSAMVRLNGEKMSKSRGNLVFVSQLLAEGHDPMAIRLAIIAHPYRPDWDWTPQSLSAAATRLAAWRAALKSAGSAGALSSAGVLSSAVGQSSPAVQSSTGVEAPTGTRSSTGVQPSAGAAGSADPAVGADMAAGAAAGAATLAAIRERLADDLDARGAIAAVDEWAADAAGGRAAGTGGLIKDAVDALLGIAL
jgi:L-cysteine:1D-myo-inositol 2-amino-2-deoxy-alpha-D-glucopyranoside ligase